MDLSATLSVPEKQFQVPAFPAGLLDPRRGGSGRCLPVWVGGSGLSQSLADSGPQLPSPPPARRRQRAFPDPASSIVGEYGVEEGKEGGDAGGGGVLLRHLLVFQQRLRWVLASWGLSGKRPLLLIAASRALLASSGALCKLFSGEG